MDPERLTWPELLALVAVFGSPAYAVASAAQALILGRAGLAQVGRRRYMAFALVLSLVVAFPLTFLFWWAMGFVPWTVWAWAPKWLGIGGIIGVPALLASVTAYGFSGWLMLRTAHARHAGSRTR